MLCGARTAIAEGAQHALDDRTQRTVPFREALGPDPEQLLDVRLEEPIQRRLPRTPGAIDTAADLHSRLPA
jgi:hypothetical protein